MTSEGVLFNALDRHFWPTIPGRIGVAVSGGSDSLALLHILVDWGQAPLVAATVDHGLRPEAQDEAAYVARICEGLGVPHQTLTWQGWNGRGNLQDHARRNRYALLSEWAQNESIEAVCLGHTENDQAETFLMRLARESGLDGLTGMPATTERFGMRFDRPLLGVGRAALRSYLEKRGVDWVEDPSNDDAGFDRIKARQALESLASLGISAGKIGQTIHNLAQERRLVAETAKDYALRLTRVAGGDLVFDRAGLRQLNPELQRRLLAAAFRWIATEDYPPRRDALADILAAVQEKRNATLHGCLMLATDMTVRITREYNAVRVLSSSTNALWDGRWTLSGPHDPSLEVRALGDALATCEDWRDTGLPRQSLVASPAIWSGETLIAAPLAGLPNGWTAKTPNRDHFAASLISR